MEEGEGDQFTLVLSCSLAARQRGLNPEDTGKTLLKLFKGAAQ